MNVRQFHQGVQRFTHVNLRKLAHSLIAAEIGNLQSRGRAVARDTGLREYWFDLRHVVGFAGAAPKPGHDFITVVDLNISGHRAANGGLEACATAIAVIHVSDILDRYPGTPVVSLVTGVKIGHCHQITDRDDAQVACIQRFFTQGAIVETSFAHSLGPYEW
jgi:hypothetical protein